MVNIKTKKSAQMLAYVFTHELNGVLVQNENAKHKCITILNNVVKIAHARAVSWAQMFQNLQEAMDYIASYISEHCGEGYMFTSSTDTNNEEISCIVKVRYGLSNDNLPFICDCEKAFRKLK